MAPVFLAPEMPARGSMAEKSRTGWCEADERYLINHYFDQPVSLLARRLGRTKSAVAARARHLGLRKR